MWFFSIRGFGLQYRKATCVVFAVEYTVLCVEFAMQGGFFVFICHRIEADLFFIWPTFFPHSGRTELEKLLDCIP